MILFLDVPQVGFDDSMTGFEWSMGSCADRTMSSYCRTTDFDESTSFASCHTKGFFDIKVVSNARTRDLGARVKSYDT